MSWEIGKMGKLLMAPIFSIADLKRYFVSLASGNSSKPSTHESANVVSHKEQEKEVEGGTRNSTATKTDQMQDPVEALVEENTVILEAGGITDFTEYI
jgi:hypothetical protein